MKKRGLSTIIASVLIILIVLIAGSIVWFTVRNVLQENSEKISLSGLTIDLKVQSLRITNDTLDIKIKRNPGEGDLKGLKFIVFDGQQSYEFERLNIGLDPLGIKTFILSYSGLIESVSIYPIFESDTGGLIIGSVTDVYYVTQGGGGDDDEECSPNCGLFECGPVPNGCGVGCGTCLPANPFCENGICVDLPCTNDCSCASTVCIGEICLGGCNETCAGTLTLEQDCQGIMCGSSPNGCGDCSECENGYYCDAGVCVVSCIPDCEGRECGLDLAGCETSCGSCDIQAGEWCDDGLCNNETCVANCTGRVCGPDPTCSESCPPGCNVSIGEWCNAEGQCLSEQYLNNGTVFSIWPITIGIYFDSPDLPKSGVDYTNYYARFPGSSELRCLQIREYVIPVIPEVYNLSHVRFVTSSTDIQASDNYEIWETYVGCDNA